MNKLETVIFISGAAHSGSTLLGVMLGSHNEIFYGGELAKTQLMSDVTKPQFKKVCKFCGEKCRIWSKFLQENISVYEFLNSVSEKKIIVDSSKKIEWIQQQTLYIQQNNKKALLILLLRDGREVVNSRKRKGNKNFTEYIWDWKQQMEKSLTLFENFPFPKMKISYKNLCQNTETVLKEICNLLNTDFQDNMLQFYENEQHILGGNSGVQFLIAQQQNKTIYSTLNEPNSTYYQNHKPEIVYDERWKTELSKSELLEFETIAGEFNKKLQNPNF